MNHIRATPELMDALLKNPYYTKQYLRTSLGIFNTPNENDILRIFSSLLLPYEAVYREIVTKPDYAKRILAEYDKNNNKFPRKFKEIVRGVLCVIYILFIPLYSLCESPTWSPLALIYVNGTIRPFPLDYYYKE
jgi:hypothetical protein